MEVAAMAPVALDKATPAERHRQGARIASLPSRMGKPAEMAEKIAMGRLNKFFKEHPAPPRTSSRTAR